jgi:hypothetical protein
MTERKLTITITRERLDMFHREQKAARHLRDNLNYLTGIFSDLPEVQKKIQLALDEHKTLSQLFSPDSAKEKIAALDAYKK